MKKVILLVVVTGTGAGTYAGFEAAKKGGKHRFTLTKVHRGAGKGFRKIRPTGEKVAQKE